MKAVLLTLCILCGLTLGKELKKRIKTTKCKYTFVVNEIGADSCPNALPQQQADILPYRSLTTNQPRPLKIPPNKTPKDGSELKSWLTNMEKQLGDELKKSSNINSTLLKHENSLMKAEKLLSEYESNFTAIFRMLRYLETSLQEQNMVSINLDKKLSGVMLDMSEVNTVLNKKVAAKDGNILEKIMEVQSAAQVSSCQKSPESVIYRGGVNFMVCIDAQSGILLSLK